MSGEDVSLSAQGALAFAMGLHELCTNAVKHGALSVKDGRIDIAWRIAAGRLRLAWREHGGPEVLAPARRGFGLRVIEASFRDQLHGGVELSFAPAGFGCEIDLPVARLVAPRREAALTAIDSP